MAQVWVMSRSEKGTSGNLIRADAITRLISSEESLAAVTLGSDEAVTLAHEGGRDGAPFMPAHFPLALLTVLGRARAAAQDGGEDVVVVPVLDGDHGWAWSIEVATEIESS